MRFLYDTIFKMILLALILFSWKVLDSSCILFAVILTIVTFFLAMSFAENRLLYRKNLADVIFKEGSLFHGWLNRKWFVLLFSFIKALAVGILLLVSMMQWNEHITQVMLIDVILISGIYVWFVRYFGKHTQEDVTHLVARKSAIITNTLIIVPILIVVMLYSMPPEFVSGSVSQTVNNAKASTVPVSCEILSVLQTYDNVREGLGWWVMFKASSSVESSIYTILAWILFLMMQTVYIWIFSRLILSATIRWDKIFSKTGKYKLDHFSIGFFGMIVFLVVLTLTFVPNKPIAETEPVETNATFIAGVLKKIDDVAKEERNYNIKAINSFIDTEVHNLFNSVYANIPAYTEKQYTWYRDYISIYQVAAKKLSDGWEKWKYYINTNVWKDDVAYPSLTATKSYAQKSSDEIQQILFGNGAFDRHVYDLQIKINKYTQDQIAQSKDNILHSLLTEERINLSASELAYIQSINNSIAKSFSEARNSLIKTAVAYKAGELGATIVLTKVIVAKLLAKSGVKVGTKVGAKAVAKTGGFLGGTTAGLAICAPAGPWAIACGAATGTLVWIGVDFAVSEVDEILTRDEFEGKLRKEIERNEDAFKLRMLETYEQGINKIFNDLNSTVRRRPIDVM